MSSNFYKLLSRSGSTQDPDNIAGNLAQSRARVTAASRSLPPQLNAGRIKVDTMEMMRHPEETTNMKRQTVASYFRYSLMDLLSKMVVGQPHFVRCIKPNDNREAMKFSRDRVLMQLRYTGILETVNIRRQGYSHRILFEDFLKRYYYLAFKAHQNPPATKESCTAILGKAKLENWVLGKTKVFLKYYHVEQLNLLLREVIGRVVVMQAYTKGWLGARRYKKVKEKRHKSATCIQAAWRGYDSRKKFQEIRGKRNEAATVIQAAFKGYVARKNFIVLKKSNSLTLADDLSDGENPSNYCTQWQENCIPSHFTESNHRDKQSGQDSDVCPNILSDMNDSEVVAHNRYSNSHESCRSTGSEIFIERKLRTRRRCQQPKTLNSPEDSMYYNQINGTLDYQGSKRKPRKLGQVKVLDREDEYYKLLSAADSIPEEDLSVYSPLAQQEMFFASS